MRNIRKMIRKILIEESKPTVVYSAVVIEKLEGIGKLDLIFSKYIENGWKKPTHYHMTIGPGKFPESLYLKGDLDKEVTLEITSIGISEKAIALGVSGYYSRNDNPHITIAFNKENGGNPEDSKVIENWGHIDNFYVTGIIREVGENNLVIK